MTTSPSPSPTARTTGDFIINIAAHDTTIPSSSSSSSTTTTTTTATTTTTTTTAVTTTTALSLPHSSSGSSSMHDDKQGNRRDHNHNHNHNHNHLNRNHTHNNNNNNHNNSQGKKENNDDHENNHKDKHHQHNHNDQGNANENENPFANDDIKHQPQNRRLRRHRNSFASGVRIVRYSRCFAFVYLILCVASCTLLVWAAISDVCLLTDASSCEDDTNEQLIFYISDISLSSLFVLEVLVRVAAERMRFFRFWRNWLDVFLIMCCLATSLLLVGVSWAGGSLVFLILLFCRYTFQLSRVSCAVYRFSRVQMEKRLRDDVDFHAYERLAEAAVVADKDGNSDEVVGFPSLSPTPSSATSSASSDSPSYAAIDDYDSLFRWHQHHQHQHHFADHDVLDDTTQLYDDEYQHQQQPIPGFVVPLPSPLPPSSS